MCQSVRYLVDGQICSVAFRRQGAKLPVLNRRLNHIDFLPWGRRPNEGGQLPIGGWARRAAIHAGAWDAWRPKPVRLMICGFQASDVLDRPQWFEVTRGQFVQGLLGCAGNEQRLYVVTLDSAPEDSHFPRWPRVLSAA